MGSMGFGSDIVDGSKVRKRKSVYGLGRPEALLSFETLLTF
jgi:hypothetical protein